MLISPLSILNPLGNHGGSTWAPSKLPSKIIGWFREIDEVGGVQPNKMDGGATVLTIVSGTGLNKVYQLPAGWVSYDTDNAWWKTDASLSVTDGNRLIAYDFARTIVKYDNTSPYTLREIIILSEALTTDEMNHLRDYAQLSTWWDGTGSLYGYTKGNRSGERSIWAAESVYDALSSALFARMVSAGETPTDARKTIIDNTIALGKTKAFWTKMDAIWLLAAHGEASHLMNWLSTDYSLTQSATKPTFTIDQGGAGNGSSSYYRTNYAPDGTKNYKINSASMGVYSRTSGESASMEIGSTKTGTGANNTYISTRWTGAGIVAAISGGQIVVANTNGTGLYITTRNISTAFDVYKNKTGSLNNANNSTGISIEPYLLCQNVDNTSRNAYSTKQIALGILGGGFIQQDVDDIFDVFVGGYLTSIGASI